MKKVVSLSFLLFQVVIFASLGRPIPTGSIPKGVCQLTLEHQIHGEVFHCTGSLISKNHIKTAGHCLQESTLKEALCGTQKITSFKDIKRFPHYQHHLIQRDEQERWVDQAIIHFSKEVNLPTLKAITDYQQLNNLMPRFQSCLIAGFGINEESAGKTGQLKATAFPPHSLELRKKLLYAKGVYQYELLPGDSGGALICYYQGLWFDIGTASAHDWDHNSLFAPNFLAKDFLESFNFNENLIQNTLYSLNSHEDPTFDIVHGETYKLKPYSKIQTRQGERYNGDMKNIVVKVLELISSEEVFVQIKINDTSRFYLCDEKFLCYGEFIEGIVKVQDLINDISYQR